MSSGGSTSNLGCENNPDPLAAGSQPMGSCDQVFSEGLALFEVGNLEQALTRFDRALKLNPDHAQAGSYLGVCIASQERRFEHALALCSEAAKQEFFNPDLYLNLARIHLQFGFRSEGRRYLLRGRMIDPANLRIRTALSELGARGEPVLGFLPRRHILNRWLGSARHAFSWSRMPA